VDASVRWQGTTPASAGTTFPDEVTSDAVADTARLLLDDKEIRLRAHELAVEIAALPSPHRTVERLTGFAQQ